MTVLAAELLKEAEVMIGQRIHPQIIISGYRKALAVAKIALEKAAKTSRFVLFKGKCNFLF